MSDRVTIAVIGTAGRSGDPRLSYMSFLRAMPLVVDCLATACIELDIDLGGVTLVSGGSAWSDHLAVRLYLAGVVDALHLVLPCAFSIAQCRFTGGGPARALNRYHGAFTRTTGAPALEEIATALMKGATHEVRKGFFPRNRAIARQCSRVIALGVEAASDGGPKTRGTRFTWDLCKGKARDLVLYPEVSEEPIVVSKFFHSRDKPV